MATLESQDANILDAEVVNWRRIVYPVVGFIVLLLGGLGIYYYQQSQRDQQEADARQALLQAKTPETLVDVANRFSKTTQADFALMSAAELSLAQKDFATATKDYQRVVDASGTDAVLRDAARVGLASTAESRNKPDEALQIYLAVAHRGHDSPYAPFAYISAARIYDFRNDKSDERNVLREAADLGGDSSFVKDAGYRLKALDSSAQTPAGTPTATLPSLPATAPK